MELFEKLFGSFLSFFYTSLTELLLTASLRGLLRPNRHQRLLERLVSAGASGSFLSSGDRRSNREQGGARPAYPRLPELGGSLCRQPQDPHRVGPKRCPQRGS